MGEESTSYEYDDRISELPDFIIHQMLSYLPAKEAAKLCILSKRWQHIWETFPILDCNQLFFGRYLDLINPKEVGLPKDKRRQIFDQRVKFILSVDERLRRVCDKDVCLRKFRLVMTLVSLELLPRVDSWMEVVTGLGVQELELHLTVGRERFYALPMKLLTAQSLTILSLRGCSLIPALYRDDLKLCSLVELHLQGSFIDEDSLQNLISSIHSLEVLSLKWCLGIRKLEVNGYKKLKKIVYHPHRDFKVEAFRLNLPNLNELEVSSIDNAKQCSEFFAGLLCPNVKRLSLFNIPIGVKALQKGVSSFCLLERLFLGGSVVAEELKISSSIVKEVHLRNCTTMVKAEFDTPALRVLQYYGKNMPQLSLSNVAGRRIAEVRVSVSDMDISWFLKLNVFVKEHKFQDLRLSITAGPSDEIPVITKDCMRTNLSQPFGIESLKLILHGYTSMKSAAILDGLLWKLRPKNLKIELNYNSPDYMKGLLKRLVDEVDPDCCCSKSLDCWRHSLKDIKLANVKGFESGTPLNLFTLSSLNIFLDKWVTKAKRTIASYGTVEGEILSFDLSW